MMAPYSNGNYDCMGLSSENLIMNKFKFKEYIDAVARTIWTVKMPREWNNSQWAEVGDFLWKCYEENVPPEEAGNKVIEKFGHGETLH